jgi:hypothetical protein
VTWRARTGLALAGLRAGRGAALVDAAAAALGAAALVLFVGLGLGVGAAARALFPADDRLVEVVPGPVSLGGLLGGGLLDDAAVARLAALPGVRAAWPRLTLQVPVAASQPPRGLEGAWARGMTLQLPVVGVEPGLVSADTGRGIAFADPTGGGGGPIPAVLSRRLLEIYDKTIAPSWGAPRLPPGFDPVGLELPVEVGRSILPGGGDGPVVATRLRLAGLSDRVPLYALAVPLATVRRLHAEHGRPDRGFSQVTLLAARPDDAPPIAAAVRRMGFSIDSGDRSAAERVGTVVAITTAALGALALLMSLMAGLAIARSRAASVATRSRDLALLLALGATPTDVRVVVLLEAGILGGGGGLCGVALGRAGAWAGDLLAQRLLPDFPFRPETFFQLPGWLVWAALLIAAGSAVVGALGPAAAAARVDPARALS